MPGRPRGGGGLLRSRYGDGGETDDPSNPHPLAHPDRRRDLPRHRPKPSSWCQCGRLPVPADRRLQRPPDHPYIALVFVRWIGAIWPAQLLGVGVVWGGLICKVAEIVPLR